MWSTPSSTPSRGIDNLRSPAQPCARPASEPANQHAGPSRTAKPASRALQNIHNSLQGPAEPSQLPPGSFRTCKPACRALQNRQNTIQIIPNSLRGASEPPKRYPKPSGAFQTAAGPCRTTKRASTQCRTSKMSRLGC